MAAKKYVSLIPLNETRRCDKCQAWTWWMAPKQRTLGRCLDCHEVDPASDTPEQFARAFALILATFPGATVTPYVTPRYRPNAYAGPDAGPCLGCHRRVRRYGPDAYPYCLACRPRPTEEH